MYVIGERINGMFQDVKKAIQTKDAGIIQDLAKKQLAAGAQALDINVGPASAKATEAMQWLVDVVQDVTDATLAIDTAKWDVMSEIVPKVKNPVIINSSKADEDALEKYSKLAVDNNASLLALTIDQQGVPDDADRRVEMGAMILTKAMEAGLPTERLFIDPIILPTNVANTQPKAVLDALFQLKLLADPAPHFVLGLSNVSQNCANRELINRTYLAMAIAAGLDSAILDPNDTELMNAAITAELLLNKAIYCDSFLDAYRSQHGS